MGIGKEDSCWVWKLLTRMCSQGKTVYVPVFVHSFQSLQQQLIYMSLHSTFRSENGHGPLLDFSLPRSIAWRTERCNSINQPSVCCHPVLHPVPLISYDQP
uniref:Uncharacterized protein n=1 Tax=Vannella robusta TaxID=1487602 RepID=A0A7S4M9W9_9EUKA